MPDLRQYAQQMQKKGYSKQNIRNFLLSKGYSETDIDSALKIKLTKKELFAISMVIIAFLALIFLLITFLSEPKENNPVPAKSIDINPITNEPDDDIPDDTPINESHEDKNTENIKTNNNENEETKVYEIMDTLQHDKKKAIEDCMKHPEKNECLKQIAAKIGSPELCLKINNTVDKDGCLADLALNGQDTLCNEISDQYLRDGCEILTEK